MHSRAVWVVAFTVAAACGGAPKPPITSTPPPEPTPDAGSEPAACGGGKLQVAFFNAGQALAALVTLPDGKHILVDAGESPTRPGCGAPCASWHQPVMDGLARELGDAPIDLVWITHPHSDHIGGAVDVLNHFAANAYADNGRDLTKATIKATRDTLMAHHVPATVVEPGSATVPRATGEEVKLTAIVPPQWYPECASNANVCSIALRIDYCSSSILFTGDAEALEETDLPISAPVTLLQVGHHGSKTSSSAAFLDRVRPKYAVISAGLAGEGTNSTYCHPRKETVDALTTVLGGAGTGVMHAFPSDAGCSRTTPDSSWGDEPASDRLWVTARDGDVALVTTGDGGFTRD
jgi:competence protein ComEC